jgi:hypothetical protein
VIDISGSNISDDESMISHVITNLTCISDDADDDDNKLTFDPHKR